jgi:hypothetical protein
MSMSTPQGKKRPANVITTGDKPTPRSTGSPSKSGGGSKPTGSGKPGGRSGFKVEPVRVNQKKSWGPIALWGAVAVAVALIVGYAAYAVYNNGITWQERAAGIKGIVNYNKTAPGDLTRNHKAGPLTFKQSPPVGGDHNPVWMRCLGDVYNAPIPKEHAVHSLEHGAIWITYRPDLPAAQVKILADKVHKVGDFIFMSPYPGLDRPISLQSWGYQLKLDNANDSRIDAFIKALRIVNAPEQGVTCSSQGITEPGTTPFDISQ